MSVGIRVGIDLTAAADVSESLAIFADRYLARVYTESEQQDCRGPDGYDAQRLAARFAAKEATVKVLRPGRDVAIPWRSIEVRRAPDGAPELRLSGAASALAVEAGLEGFQVSLTHERGMAAAVVVAEVVRA